jgi:hypothetical protein
VFSCGLISQEEAAEFFRIWLGLLAFVNDKFQIVEGFGHPTVPTSLSPGDVFPVRDKLWEDASIIDEYIASQWDMPREDIAVLKGWKNRVADTFTIFRHLKKHSIFIDSKNRVYGVLGISGPIGDTLYMDPPLFAKAVLLPFKGKIIYDSIMSPYNVYLGGNIKREYGDIYRVAKEDKAILTEITP